MIDKLQVGEYCRTAGGRIFKVSEVVTFSGCNYIPKDENKTLVVSAIVKHSPNLIDIIEEGDYVNGEIVIKIFNPRFLSFGELPYIITANYNNKYEPQEIEEIVTKEQFESVSYKVKE